MSANLPNFTEYGYELIKVIGRNRQGGRVTYLAKDINRECQVIIKHFQFISEVNPWWGLETLEQEIELLQQLNHPRIPRYLNSFNCPQGIGLVLEYIEAESLSKIGYLHPIQIKTIAISLLEILVYLQQQIPPIIHRDIKPDNILIDDQFNGYLIDLGFGRVGIEEVSGSSTVKGTLGFMPPEQLSGKLTKASDLYSLGVTLFCQMKGLSSTEMPKYLDHSGSLDLGSLETQVSESFIAWLSRMVQPNPSDRFSDATTALRDLLSITMLPPASVTKSFQKPLKTSLKPFLTNRGKTIGLCTIIGLTVGVSWGWIHQALALGLILGLILGSGLSLIFTYHRSYSGFLGIPPLSCLFGVILTALATGLIINPALIINGSQYSKVDLWNPRDYKVAEGTGFTLYSDHPNSQKDQQLQEFLNQFRTEVNRYLFDPGSPSCSTEVHFFREDKNYYAAANYFGLNTDYGFLVRPLVRSPLVIMREDSGLGTLTHQMMYHYLGCSYPEGIPGWAAQGAGSFVEKFLAFEEEGKVNFSWGYRSNWRDVELRQRLDNIDFKTALIERNDQSLFRSLFLFLHHQQKLVPLLNRLHGAKNDGILQLETLFKEPIEEIEKEWREWMNTEALNLPMVQASFMSSPQETKLIKPYLRKYWTWNQKKEIWLKQNINSPDVIPYLQGILQNRNPYLFK
ncbi:serine/threonine protein kinase [Crocosphaera chwakensis]|uniref:non-specific serine/threonine protein kinase n=1 Tax=Crocosphaera chwakensis CCY0110 TaxID=391612 RepID=A3IQ87_9CHRO|nr:serine/threonine-protein kinase [Crocosphaera chwakensis]EAZ91427.1 serine/threonine kinase [Crocosphaera chwakensis CCY0110]